MARLKLRNMRVATRMDVALAFTTLNTSASGDYQRDEPQHQRGRDRLQRYIPEHGQVASAATDTTNGAADTQQAVGELARLAGEMGRALWAFKY